MLYWGYSQE